MVQEGREEKGRGSDWQKSGQAYKAVVDPTGGLCVIPSLNVTSTKQAVAEAVDRGTCIGPEGLTGKLRPAYSVSGLYAAWGPGKKERKKETTDDRRVSLHLQLRLPLSANRRFAPTYGVENCFSAKMDASGPAINVGAIASPRRPAKAISCRRPVFALGRSDK